MSPVICAAERPGFARTFATASSRTWRAAAISESIDAIFCFFSSRPEALYSSSHASVCAFSYVFFAVSRPLLYVSRSVFSFVESYVLESSFFFVSSPVS